MMKFYQTNQFKALNAEWRKKLRTSGFSDIETPGGFLKDEFDRRTIAWRNREKIAEYFRKLDHFLQNNSKLPRRDRLILLLYSQGTRQKEIARKVKYTTETVRVVIRKYEKTLLSGS